MREWRAKREPVVEVESGVERKELWPTGARPVLGCSGGGFYLF